MIKDFTHKAILEPPYSKKRGPRKKFKSYLSLNLEEQMYQNLVKLSEKNNETMSEIVRRALNKEIERGRG
jgi:FixJ family two-component response regulator